MDSRNFQPHFSIVKMSPFWLLLLLLLLGGGGVAVYTMTRGYRNNNPGNLRLSADQWDGLSLTQTDPDFFQFTDAVFGIRALAKTLLNYGSIHGLNTVAQIISRWAPGTENDTNAYIRSVADALGVPADAPINIATYLPQLVTAIIRHENGFVNYNPSVIAQGIALAA